MSVRILEGDALTVLRTLPDQSVQMCVTSPPYFGLRDYGVVGQLGLEKTPQLYVDAMVGVFSEVKRVLRDDGTLWLNIGDSYANVSGGAVSAPSKTKNLASPRNRDMMRFGGCKTKDLVGIPWMLAFALRDDGWYLRSEIIWHKPNPMPESVTDRPTKAHEYLFLLSKLPTYFYDAEAILEPVSPNTNMRVSQNVAAQIGSERANGGGKTNGNMKAVIRGAVNPKAALNARGSKQNESFSQAVSLPVLQRNKRSVWTVTTQGYSEAHFATFPPKLIEPCILAGSASSACEKCGGPWEREFEPTGHVNKREPAHVPGNTATKVDSTGWAPMNKATDRLRPTCDCENKGTARSTVLDPFMGAGTTGLVADRLGRDCIGIELNPKYAEMARKRITDDSPLFGSVA